MELALCIGIIPIAFPITLLSSTAAASSEWLKNHWDVSTPIDPFF